MKYLHLLVLLMFSAIGTAQSSKIVVFVNKDSARITVNKKLAGFARKDSAFLIPINPGKHIVIAQWENEKLQSGKISISEGEVKELSFEFKDVVFLVVEEQATFNNGGLSAFNKWLSENIKYPQEAYEQGISGKVYVQFVVNEIGTVEKVKVLRGEHPVLNEEAIRVIMESPTWRPAKHGGRLVKQMFTMPINFNLTNIKSDSISQDSKILISVNADSANIVVDDSNITFIKKDTFINVPVKPGKHTIYALLKNEKSEVQTVMVGKNEALKVSINFTFDQIESAGKREISYLLTEESATFLGGDLGKFHLWVLQNLKYPHEALNRKLSGSVRVQFTVNESGIIEDVKVVKSVNPLLDNEAVRVILSSPRWKPGRLKGKNAKQIFTMPVNFGGVVE
jgi:TonB family protein